MQIINRNPDIKELRDFGFITGGLTPAIFGLLLPWIFERDFTGWPWIVGTILIAFALFLPASLRPVYRGWMTIGNCLGWINTRIILSIMFYLIIMPVGITLRILGKDAMAPIIKGKTTYRIASDVPDNKHVEKPY